ncbi:hypothetical protein M0P65_03960 [Candidatus Gracilibacteria bacterium]|nr:hypothetical protein [Candidatus Gracilibacteria bacterium]
MKLNIDKYETLILELPLDNHGFLVKYKNWKKNFTSEFTKIYSILFESNEDISINRKMLFSLGKKAIESEKLVDYEKFILYVLAWGYSSGRIGTYKNSRKIFKDENIETMARCLKTNLKQEVIGSEQFKKIVNELDGLGLSSITKIIYFLDIKIDNLKPAILDLQIIEVLNSNIFYQSSENIVFKYGNSEHYFKYLELLNKEKIETGKVELFLFIFGRSLV